MLHKGTTDGPRHRDLGRGFFWLDAIRSIRIDSSLEIDTIFRYVASALSHISIRYSIHGLHTTYLLARTGPLYILHASC